MFDISKAAVNKVKEELREMDVDTENPLIRVYVAIGWGGPRIELALEESTNPRDTVVEVDGVTFLVDENQMAYFRNKQLDYTKNLFGLGEFYLTRL